ncbi:MAG: DMT family transporter [Rhizobiaceae bacterium]
MLESKGAGHLLPIGLVVGSTAMMAVSDVTAKILVETVPVVEVMWFRYVVLGLLSAIAFLVSGLTVSLGTIDHRMQILRGVSVTASAIFFAMGLIRLPIGEATGITFLSPILVTVLSVVFLGEHVGWRRWIAVAVGFVGIVLIAKPQAAPFQMAVLLPLAAALCWATALIATRRMGAGQNVFVTMLYSATVGICMTSAAAVVQFHAPSLREVALGLLSGTSAAIGQALVILAYQRAPASQLAPFSYIQVPFATLFGYVLFGALPGAVALVGILLVILCGIYTGRRERRKAQATPLGRPGPP